MILDLSFYLWILSASALITAILSWFAWRRRAMPGAVPFALLMLDGGFWAVTNALEMAGRDLPTKLFWANLQYLSYTTIPVLWLVLTLQFTGQERWLKRSRLALLLAIPAITNGLVWTNPAHGLMRRDVFLDTNGPFPVVGKTYGPWAGVHTLYSYLLMGTAVILLVRALFKASAAFRGQVFVLLVGLLLPLLWNALYLSGLSPIQRHDIAPAMLSLAGLAAFWGLFQFRMFDLLPFAQDAILFSIGDGVVVLDAQQRVVALNPAAQQLWGWTSPQVVGRKAEQVFSPWPDLVQLILARQPSRSEFLFSPSGERSSQANILHFDLTISPLVDQFSHPIGQLIILHDITERKEVEAELRSLSLTDPLTGLPNRRKFYESMQLEVDQSRRYKFPLAVIMIDVNGLKRINDTLGHPAGDRALREVARCIRYMRQSDVQARIGGDEFALLLPFTSLHGAEQAAKRLLQTVHDTQLEGDVPLSMSLGIAELEAGDDERGESLLARADQAMYQAKQSGTGYVVAGGAKDG